MRLRQADREAIEAVLISRAMEAAKTVHRKTENNLANAAYEEMYSKTTRAEMEALPKGWLSENEHISIGKRYTQGNCTVSFPSARRFLDMDNPVYDVPELLKPSTALKQRTVDYLAALDELANREQRLREQVRGVLASVPTWKKLFEIWPESHDALKKLEPEQGGNAMAVIPQDLNKALGLP